MRYPAQVMGENGFLWQCSNDVIVLSALFSQMFSLCFQPAKVRKKPKKPQKQKQ